MKKERVLANKKLKKIKRIVTANKVFHKDLYNVDTNNILKSKAINKKNIKYDIVKIKKKQNSYLVFMIMEANNKIITHQLLKEFNSEIEADTYFYRLLDYIENNSNNTIILTCYNSIPTNILLRNIFNNKNSYNSDMDFLYDCNKIYFDKNDDDIVNINLKDFSKYSQFININYPKKTINTHTVFKDVYEISIIKNYIVNKSIYEVYLCIEDGKDIASGLLNRAIRNKAWAYLYFKYLKYMMEKNNIDTITKIIRKKTNDKQIQKLNNI